MDLRLARQSKRLTQIQLSEFTGIKQSCLSLAENGHLILNEDEKNEIHFVLGGAIDWKATENQTDHGLSDFAMPKVDPNPPEVKYQIKHNKLRYRRVKEGGPSKYELIPVGEQDDTDLYDYSS